MKNKTTKKVGRKTKQQLHDQKMNKIMHIGLAIGGIAILIYIYQTAAAPIGYKNDIIEEVKTSTETIIETIKEETASVVFKITEQDYRLTSYHTNDGTGSGTRTGSGKSVKDFKVNSNGWYIYNGKVVMAAATNECLNSHSGACGKWNAKVTGRHYFNYYDELTIVIDGVEYDAIILDSCGASMYKPENLIDVFVAGSNHVINRGYKGVNPIQVITEVK